MGMENGAPIGRFEENVNTSTTAESGMSLLPTIQGNPDFVIRPGLSTHLERACESAGPVMLSKK